MWNEAERRRSIAASLLVVGMRLEAQGRASRVSTPLHDSIRLADGFGFVVGVIADFGIPAERAWQVPFALASRLGTLDPDDLCRSAKDIAAACATKPVLHRFPDRLATFIHAAAQRTSIDLGGEAKRLWSNAPTAAELQRRFERFAGIGQKKAAMAIDLLAREGGVEIRAPSGSDVAYDVHVRRVFTRTGIVDQDSPTAVIEAARELSPGRPAALDYPAWHVGRVYCRPKAPACSRCPLEFACRYAEQHIQSEPRQLLLLAR